MTRKHHPLTLLSLLSLAMLGACQTQQAGTEQAGQELITPQQGDDYSALTNIEHYRSWGTYNVHDPSVIKAGDHYYMYSTDAIWWPEGARQESDSIPQGNIHVRRSADLVNWEFLGWAFDTIPDEAQAHLREATGGKEAQGIWAPYIQEWEGGYRLFYSVSVFGANTSAIGLATSASPEGPWEPAGLVVKTFESSAMNAIDPSVVVDAENGRHWMIYGSYFGGLFALELNPKTGLALKEGDQGRVVARRAEGKERIIEAPEVIYNPATKKYYLFVSYDPLFTHYNLRVGRADRPEGPYLDFFGNDLAETTNNYPVITYPYRFEGHPGWAGVAHNSVINDGGRFFTFHQGRLSPENLMMVLHAREIFWTEDEWPVVSPQRYAGVPQTAIREADLAGSWEVIQLAEVQDTVTLWQGQIPPGGWHYSTAMFNNPSLVQLQPQGQLAANPHYSGWTLKGTSLQLQPAGQGTPLRLILSRGWDWENRRETIVFTGLNEQGYGVWGKQVSAETSTTN
jgi:arabinan endo-1,5-alpha-L-arabinosidase